MFANNNNIKYMPGMMQSRNNFFNNSDIYFWLATQLLFSTSFVLVLLLERLKIRCLFLIPLIVNSGQ